MTRSLRRTWLGLGLLVAAAVILIALTWFGALRAVEVERQEANARVAGEVANQALLFEGQLQRELVALDQTLRILEHEWESHPTNFDLEGWRERALVLSEVSLHIFVTDAAGVIRASTRPELIGVNVSGRDYFRYEAEAGPDGERMFIGPSTRGLVTNRWQMNMARRLDTGDGRFAGVIAASYDTNSLTRFYRQADLGENGLIAVVGLRDGQLRALVGPPFAPPQTDISASSMMAALRADPNGRWTGPSAPDGIRRIHGFRLVPERDLVVVVAFDAASAMRPSESFAKSSEILAAGITGLVLVTAASLLRGMWMAGRREAALRSDRIRLAKANADLQASRRRADAKAAQLEATLAGMSDGVSMLDADLRLVAWNTLFSDFTGVPRELLQFGAPMEELLRGQALAGEFGAVDVDAEVARRMELLRSGDQPSVNERRRPDGRVVELRRRPLPDGGYVTLYTDITVRKQAEETMRRAREIAEATTEAKSRFVATVSHEIRTPLNTLLNSLRLLADSGVPASQRRFVEMARQAGDGLLCLINDILELSRMEAGRLTLRPSLFAVRPLLESVLDLFGDQAKGRGLRLSLSLAAEVPELIESDAGRVRQILINLVGNAVKFAGLPGCVVLRADLQGGEGGATLRLTVRDPGPALSEAERSSIFQPFSRLDRTRAEEVPGTGLGLAICQALASLMDGTIGCAGSPDGGNDFWLDLPVDIEKGRVAGAPQTSPLTRKPPRTRVLLVEDVVPNQLVTATLLRREGHMVDVAGSGQMALRMLDSGCYDIVLMDVFMPGMTGLEATRRIRARPSPTGSIPIIALTANVAAEDCLRCQEAGMSEFVAKPVDLGRLLEAIGRHVWRMKRPGSDFTAPPLLVAASPTPTLCKDRVAELRANLTTSTLVGLAEDCLAELRVRLTDLRAALADEDAAAVEQEAHAMAGLAASYGLAALERQLRVLMEATRGGAVARARMESVGLQSELERAGPALLGALKDELVEG